MTPVDRMNSPDEPAPWLHPHLQTAGTSQLLQADPPANTASVLRAFGFCLGTLPLATGGPPDPVNGRQYRCSPSHVPCKSRRPGSRRLCAGHRLANTRAPARLIPRELGGPSVLMPPEYLRRFDSDARPGEPVRTLLARLPGPHLTHRCAPFPCRSPRRSSANAAQGGLAPAPVGRRWRANNLHLLHSTASERCLLHDSSFRRS